MLNIWSVKTGYLFEYLPGVYAPFPERKVTSIILPTTGDLTGVTFKVISGKLPNGLRLDSNKIVGTTFEVSQTTTSTFVIRASKLDSETNLTSIADRTFSIIVEGPDAPVWITPEGTLPVGIDPYRVSKITKFSRTNNIVTLWTDVPHNFIFGNKIFVNTPANAEIYTSSTEVLRPRVLVDETAEEYSTRYKNTITFFKNGPDIPETAVSGTIELLKDPLTFVLDGTYIDFQLQAADTDLRAGDELDFFIEEGNGNLPPGLSLSRSGRITGYIDPIISLDITARDGTYDANLFDNYAFDFSVKGNISDPNWQNVLTPKKLNRYYEFVVTVTDGESPSLRSFRIYVVGDDFLRCDNTVMKIGGGTFSADATYLRSPFWLSASNLGIKRANNYVTVILDTFDPNPSIGPIDYRLEAFNDDGSVSELPPGLFLDTTNAEIFGFVPYQPAITLDYKFTISVVKYDKENTETVEVAIVTAEDTPYGRSFIRINKLPVEDQLLITNDSIRIGAYAYTITEYVVTDQGYDIIKLNTNLKDSLIDNFIITKTYNRLLSTEYTTRKSSKTFSMQVLGEVDSVISWITPENLGSIRANIASQLEVQAKTTVADAVLTYKLISGTLPPGVELKTNGQLIGRVTQFGNITYRSFWRPNTVYKIDDVVKVNNVLYKVVYAHTSGATFNPENWSRYTFVNNIKGLTTYDNRTTTFDGLKGTYDRLYTFTIQARDQFAYSATTRTFTVFIQDPDVKLFSNIYARPLPSQAKRTQFYTFINNLDIFTPDKIYRSSDPNFGVQTEIKMLMYAGIETVDTANYIPALLKNTKRKRFRIGSPKKAIAKETGTNNVIYEVVYLEVFDEYEVNKKSAAKTVRLPINSRSPVKVNQSRLDVVNGQLGTVSSGSGPTTTYLNETVSEKLNQAAPDRYRPVDDPVTADLTMIKASGNNVEYAYPASSINMRDNIKNIIINPDNPETARKIDSENSFLPQWMITPQDNRTAATGFIKAIPLCYCKPGGADYILQNIARSGFDFTQLDFEIDRFVIDAVSGEASEQYLKFPNYKFNV